MLFRSILQGWVAETSPTSSPPSGHLETSQMYRLDGPNRSKRLPKDLQAVTKRPRRDNPSFFSNTKTYNSPNSSKYDPFLKSIRTTPDNNFNRRDPFASKNSNKVHFDGPVPRQRTKIEKENYEKRYDTEKFKTRDSSPKPIYIHCVSDSD